jgi:hypothetical protein
MSSATLTDTTRRELARRVSGDLEITLYWNALDNSTTIDIDEAATEETISFAVPGERALDAFHHPFAYRGATLA